MRPRSLLAVGWVALYGALTLGCARQPADDGSVSPMHGVGNDAPTHIRLGAEAAARAGVRSAVVERAENQSEVTAFGRVLDPLPLIELRQARTVAAASLTVARAEAERVARLHRDDLNASTRDLEAAQAARDKANAELAAAAARLALGWGPAGDVDETILAGFVAGRVALLRVDVPAESIEPADSAQVAEGAAGTRSPHSDVPATVTVVAPGVRRLAPVLGRAPTTDPLVQGESWLATLADDPPRPGTILDVRVPRPAAAVTAAAVAVPASALVWVDARPAVYVEGSAGEFERRAVTLGSRHDDEWIVVTGLAPAERVVVAGAARLVASDLATSQSSED